MNIPAVLADAAVCLGILESRYRHTPLSDRDIDAALARPLWPAGRRDTLFDIIRPGESVCLIVSDSTRKTAADRVLPVLLAGLKRKGCSLDDLFVLVATGIHRPPTPEEIEQILGAPAARIFQGRVFVHDSDDKSNLVSVGATKRGHEVRVNRRAMEAARRILIGAATYHYHAGFGGGRKALVPGLAARDTIAYNHSLTLDPTQDRIDPRVDVGVLDGNPVSEEMLEGAYLCRPDIIINTVLTPEGELAGVFSGELDMAHRAACRLVEEICRVDIREPANFVLASAGRAPNWIQSHKALYNASRAVRKGGRIILLAPCPEGLGNDRFRYWIKKPGVEEIFKGLRKSVEVLGQTALSTKIRGASTILVTQMSPADVTDLGIATAHDEDSAVRQVLDQLKREGTGKPTYYLMPHAGQVVPFIAPH